MSLNTINKLIVTFCERMKVDRNNIIIKSIEFDDTCTYTVRLEVNNELYSIRHFEELIMLPKVKYDMVGPYHQYDIFDKDKKGVYAYRCAICLNDHGVKLYHTVELFNSLVSNLSSSRIFSWQSRIFSNGCPVGTLSCSLLWRREMSDKTRNE